ncbi:MAG: hypothetical protein H0W57_13510 [Rubrobacteraceae bacterium]|nr:hypothetical protein [Rubrobacteraceae bacterium]
MAGTEVIVVSASADFHLAGTRFRLVTREQMHNPAAMQKRDGGVVA